MDLLTVDQLRDALPAKCRRSVSKDLISQINGTLSKPEEYENFRDNLISYGTVMAEGRFKISSYICAVRFCSFRLGGATNIDAYSRTFPAKIQRFNNENLSPKDLASYVTAYSKSKLVGLIMEQSMIPSWVLNQDMYQQALNTQADLMLHANSEKVRSDAANSILTHLKRPEVAKLEIDITSKEDSVMDGLRAATEKLVAKQRQTLQAGLATAKDIAHSKISAPVLIEADYEEVK